MLGGCAVGFTEISEIGKFGKITSRVRGIDKTVPSREQFINTPRARGRDSQAGKVVSQLTGFGLSKTVNLS